MPMKGDFLILIVDDSRMNRMVLHKHLSQEGYELIEADSADGALKLLEYRRPDLILLDVVMPEMSGFDLCKLLKQRPAIRDIPIIFITSLDSTEDKITGLELGAVDFITKPFNTAEIIARVRTQVTLRQMYRTIIDTNTRIARDLDTARRIQQNLLPVMPPAGLPGHVSFEYAYAPCDELGGDFFDIFPVSETKIVFYMIDVSGHGIASALMTIFTKSFISSHAKETQDPAQLLRMLNQQFFQERFTEKHIIGFLGILDVAEHDLTWSSAGQSVAPMLYSGDQQEALTLSSFPIGLLEKADYVQARCAFPPGTSLLMYSDGVTDVRASAELPEFEEASLLDYLRTHTYTENHQMITTLLEAIRARSASENFPDDVTIFLLTRQP
jgi:phosphoserine phosphatase RsbU/P